MRIPFKTFQVLIKLYCVLLIILYCKIGLLDFTYSDQAGKLRFRACDFIQYYTASIFTRSGNPAYAYSSAKLISGGEKITGEKIKRIAWNYPPTFLLIVYPFSLASYPVSLFSWLLITFSGYLFVLYRIAPHQLTFWLVIAFPATFMNINHGQNGFFFASLLGGGLLLLNKHPIAAGILLGLFACKPQFAVFIPFALLAGRRWKALGSMGATVSVMIVISVVLFGWETWLAFFDNTPFIRRLLETGADPSPWFKMPTLFVAARMLGLSVTVSYLLQGGVAMSMLGIVYYVWSQKKGIEALNSILVLGILLATPYALVHDLTMLAIPIAYLGWQGYTKGWIPYEKLIQAVAWHMPLFTMFVALFTSLQVGPLILTACLTSALYRLIKSERIESFEVSN